MQQEQIFDMREMLGLSLQKELTTLALSYSKLFLQYQIEE